MNDQTVDIFVYKKIGYYFKPDIFVRTLVNEAILKCLVASEVVAVVLCVLFCKNVNQFAR